MGKSVTTIAKQKKNFLAALEKSLGVVTVASETSGISASNHYDWLKSDEQYKGDVKLVGERAIDFAETALFTNIKKRKERSINFFLDRRGRARGYGKTLDVTSKGDKLGEELDYSKLSTEELKNLQKIHKKLRS